MSLADQKCIPCRGGVPAMEKSRAEELLRELDDGWRLNPDGHLVRAYAFRNFAQAMAFANRVADIAEGESHHPDLTIAWGKCKVEIWTHKISGLTESDFYLAAKADRAFKISNENLRRRTRAADRMPEEVPHSMAPGSKNRDYGVRKSIARLGCRDAAGGFGNPFSATRAGVSAHLRNAYETRRTLCDFRPRRTRRSTAHSAIVEAIAMQKHRVRGRQDLAPRKAIPDRVLMRSVRDLSIPIQQSGQQAVVAQVIGVDRRPGPRQQPAQVIANLKQCFLEFLLMTFVGRVELPLELIA